LAEKNKHRPIRIFLVRHGQSDANADPSIRSIKSDAAVDLTPHGWQQALDAGKFFHEYFAKHPPQGKVALWHGSVNRQRETAQGIREANIGRITDYREDDNLIEQSFGIVTARKKDEWQSRLPEFGAAQALFKRDNAEYFFQFPGGESRFDVGRRCREVKNEILRASKEGITDFIIVTSSVPMRGLVKELLGLRYEDLRQEASPHNCDIRLIEGRIDKGYILNDGIPHEPTVIPHKSDKNYFDEGAYFPPFARGAMHPRAQLATLGL
jgi:broad specificity phosphatase PhoE